MMAYQSESIAKFKLDIGYAQARLMGSCHIRM